MCQWLEHLEVDQIETVPKSPRQQKKILDKKTDLEFISNDERRSHKWIQIGTPIHHRVAWYDHYERILVNNVEEYDEIEPT